MRWDETRFLYQYTGVEGTVIEGRDRDTALPREMQICVSARREQGNLQSIHTNSFRKPYFIDTSPYSDSGHEMLNEKE